MMMWLSANWMNILLITVIVLILYFVVRSMIRNKKTGKSVCGGNCACCGVCSGCRTCGKCGAIKSTVMTNDSDSAAKLK